MKRIQETAEAIRRVYDFSCVGGNAHIVLDDYNVEDHHIRWCLDEAMKTNVHKADEYQMSFEKKALEGLLEIPVHQRRNLIKQALGRGRD